MNLTEYDKTSVKEFNGLFDRGVDDTVPSGHAIDLQNIDFLKSGEFVTRNKIVESVNVGHTVKRQFLATFSNFSLIPLICDGAGNIYRLDTGAVILNVANMIDFTAINIFNKCVIAPILSAPSSTNYLQIWDGTNAVRMLAGFAPTGAMAAANSATAGNVSIGIHKFAVSYLTNTGFTTQPGIKSGGVFVSTDVTATGGFKVDLTGIPVGPAGTVGRVILATKSGLEDYYFLQTINDNSTTSLTVDFRDTDLAVSADYLFDLRENLQGGAGFGSMMLQTYHSRLLVAGAEADLVRVSGAGDCESFSDVTGYIQLPSEFDGNIVRAACSLFDTLYLMKSVGIYSTQDNDSGDPSSWKVVQIDGGAGAFHHCLSSITASQGALSSNSLFLLCNRQGVFIFDGTVKRPQMSWKVQALWETITPGAEPYITVVQDAFRDVFYFLVPTGGNTTPTELWTMDFTNGLDPEKVQWSKYVLPFTPVSIGMMNFDDSNDFAYHLRIGSGTKLYKLTDTRGDDLGTTPVTSYWQGELVGNESINVFHGIGLSVIGSGNVVVTAYDKDRTLILTGPTQAMSSPGVRDYVRKFNFLKERASFRLTTTGWMLVNRLDIYSKQNAPTRPA